MLRTLTESKALSELPEAVIDRLAHVGRLGLFAAGDRLLEQGTRLPALYLVLRGRVRVERSHPQLLQPFVVGELGPGELLGELERLAGQPLATSVTALEDTEVLELASSEVVELIEQYPSIGFALRPFDQRSAYAVERSAAPTMADHQKDRPGETAAPAPRQPGAVDPIVCEVAD